MGRDIVTQLIGTEDGDLSRDLQALLVSCDGCAQLVLIRCGITVVGELERTPLAFCVLVDSPEVLRLLVNIGHVWRAWWLGE